MTILGLWLCSLNRHHKVWIPADVTPITGTGIPERAYLLDAPPPSSPNGPTTSLTTGRGTFVIACQQPRCSRCAIALRLSVRHVLGWESFGDETDPPPAPATMPGTPLVTVERHTGSLFVVVHTRGGPDATLAPGDTITIDPMVAKTGDDGRTYLHPIKP